MGNETIELLNQRYSDLERQWNDIRSRRDTELGNRVQQMDNGYTPNPWMAAGMAGIYGRDPFTAYNQAELMNQARQTGRYNLVDENLTNQEKNLTDLMKSVQARMTARTTAEASPYHFIGMDGNLYVGNKQTGNTSVIASDKINEWQKAVDRYYNTIVKEGNMTVAQARDEAMRQATAEMGALGSKKAVSMGGVEDSRDGQKPVTPVAQPPMAQPSQPVVAQQPAPVAQPVRFTLDPVMQKRLADDPEFVEKEIKRLGMSPEEETAFRKYVGTLPKNKGDLISDVDRKKNFTDIEHVKSNESAIQLMINDNRKKKPPGWQRIERDLVNERTSLRNIASMFLGEEKRLTQPPGTPPARGTTAPVKADTIPYQPAQVSGPTPITDPWSPGGGVDTSTRIQSPEERQYFEKSALPEYDADRAALSSMNQMGRYLDQMETILSSPNISSVSGPLHEQLTNIGGFINYIDSDAKLAKGAATVPAYFGVLMDVVRDKITALGSGTAVSNLDLIVSQKSLGDLRNTPEGNRILNGLLRLNLAEFRERLNSKVGTFDIEGGRGYREWDKTRLKMDSTPSFTLRRNQNTGEYLVQSKADWLAEMKTKFPKRSEKDISGLWKRFADDQTRDVLHIVRKFTKDPIKYQGQELK
jgi:hypothetical protein